MRIRAQALLLAYLMVAGCGQQNQKGKSIEEKAAEGRAKMQRKLVEANIANISMLSSSKPTREIADACDKVDPGNLPPELKLRCSSAHLSVARYWFKGGFAEEGNAALARATAEGAGPHQVSALADLRKAAETKTAKRENDVKAAVGSLMRIALAKQLRQQYLDSNLDIKVTTSGKEYDRLTLHFALFNDVWANKLRKGELLEQLQKAGFTRLDMTDDYDYHVYWNLK